MSFDDQDLIQCFVEESNEHLGDVETRLLQIEDAGADVDIELVNEVFRDIHSIKGSAGFLGLSTIESLAHHLENLLNMMRNNELLSDSEITDILLQAADELQSLINRIDESNDVDVSHHITALEAIATRNSSDVPATKQEAVLAVSNDTVSNDTASNHTAPDDTSASEAVEPAEPTQEGMTMQESTNPSNPNNRAPAANATPKAGPAESVTRSTATVESNIRVSVGILDHLMNLAGELVLSRNQLLQTISTSEDSGLDAIGSRMDQITSELQEAIMLTRMQPIGSVFSRFNRLVRDLSGKLDKKCDLVLSGQEVELDKKIIESIADPLTHLVRNSIDHGIESQQARRASGKAAIGKIQLRAFHQAGKVRLVIQDDGAGINSERLKGKAVSKGLITEEQAKGMSEREAVRLIFHPGFSMAEKVTDVSGRGVGMDVVKTNIEKLGGTVDVETEIGVGTSINITLPLTLAIIPSLLVRVGDERYAIPQVSIAELVRIRRSEVSGRIGRVKDAEVLRLRGSLLPLIRLSTTLGATSKFSNAASEADDREIEHHNNTVAGAINIIVVETGPLRYGLIVDGLDDSEEIVVKPLGRHLADCPCLAGATVLGDGHVALILDVPGVASHMKLQAAEDDMTDSSDDGQSHHANETQSILMFTNGPQERFAIPMNLIARIERIKTDQIDHVGGQELLQYRGTSLPLLSLENHTHAEPRPENSRLYVAVFNVAGREIGLIVPEIVDLRDVSLDLDAVTFREPGIMGSLVLDDKAVRIVDMFELTRGAKPDWFDYLETVTESEDGQQTTILLAEDSDFFRKHVSDCLEEAGYRVVCCEDGAIAWDTLQSTDDEIDLVVTDIEMPNMNGFQFSRKIKDHADFKHIPIVALTSLSSDADVQNGREAGIDDYQVKMDRENLLTGITKLLKQAEGRTSRFDRSAELVGV